MITKDLSIHQENQTFLAYSFLMHFLCFSVVYTVTNTAAQASISVVEKWIYSFGNLQAIVNDRGVAVIKTDFIKWTNGLGIILRPQTVHSPGSYGKIETRNHYITRYWRNFLTDAGNNWSSLAPKFALLHKTSVNHMTGKTLFVAVFGTKPHKPMSLKLGTLPQPTKILLLKIRQRFTNSPSK